MNLFFLRGFQKGMKCHQGIIIGSHLAFSPSKSDTKHCDRLHLLVVLLFDINTRKTFSKMNLANRIAL